LYLRNRVKASSDAPCSLENSFVNVAGGKKGKKGFINLADSYFTSL